MKTPVREIISEHFRHDWYHYLIVIVAAVVLTSFVGMLLADVTPDDKKVDIMMMSSPCPSYAFNYFSEIMLADETLSQHDEINFYHRSTQDTNASSQLTQWLYTASGDVFILNEKNFYYLVTSPKNPGLLPLDSFIADGSLVLPEGMLEDCYTVDGKIYGLPVSYLKMFENLFPLETNPLRDNELSKLYIGIASYSGNIDGAVRSIQWMLENMLVAMDQDEFTALTDKYW